MVLKEKINKNEQVFWVLPIIGDEENENENETVISRYNYLCKIFEKTNVALVHGKMKKKKLIQA